MKKLILTGMLIILGTFAVSAQDLPSIRIVNNTGYTIFFLHASPSSDEFWSEDLLEDDVLENGQTFTYQLPQSLSEVSVYDILLEDEDGDSYYKWRVTLTNNARIVFTQDDLDAEDDG